LLGQRRGHYLVTSGPYQLDKWSDGAVVLQVFRDMANPLGVGTYDRFAIPRRAYVARITATADRIEITPEIERLERFLRQYRLVREPLGSSSDEDKADVPAARFVIVAGDGRVAAAGASREVVAHRLVVHLLNALLYASVMFLIAGGLSLIYGVMRIVNLAHGNLYAFGAYVTAWAVGRALGTATEASLWLYAILPVGAVAAALLGALLEPTLLRPLYRRAEEYQLLITFGL